MKKRVYLASPFFNDEQLENVIRTENILESLNFVLFSPRKNEIREGINIGSPEWSLTNFTNDTRGIDSCDFVVALYYGNYSDTGTAFEIGYAFATHKPVIVVHFGKDSNLMIHESCHANLSSLEELFLYDYTNLPRKRYEGKMF